MDANDNIQMGDIPALLFVPDSPSPGTEIPASQILVVSSPSLYVFARDIVIADQQAQKYAPVTNQAEQMLEALLQYKPDESSPPIKENNTPPFNLEEYMGSDGRVQKTYFTNLEQRKQRDREYEKVRLQFSYDFRELLREHNMSYRDVAEILNITVPKVRQMIQSDNITIKDLVTLTQALQGTVRILLVLPRP